MLTDTRTSPNRKLYSLPFEAVEWTGGLYKERLEVCAGSTVPHLENMFCDKDISHVVENFKIAANEAEGEFKGTVFGDGDFYKWMESAIYTGVRTDNKELLKRLEDYIELIGKAQLADGYISTKQIIGERSGKAVRLGDMNDFEVYNFGHLFTSACLYTRLTGKDNFLLIAKKAAGYLKHLYKEAEERGEVQTAVCPSHYMGLAELYRTTKDKEYLELLKKAIGLRDSVKKGMDDNQDRLPLREHKKIIGHAVRANYLYAGTADLCLEEEDEELVEVLHRMWDNLINQKIYITGGCGALYNGASPYGNFFHHQIVHQAYGYEYQLPNITAYNETCASIGGVYWAWRMFCLEKKAEYIDILERMVLNVNLAGVSMDGKKFFYENMLKRAKELPYDLIWGQERAEYILSYCCPPNLARMISQLSEYAYAMDEDGIYTVLYGASKARLDFPNGNKKGCGITLIQETQYPYDGNIRIYFQVDREDRGIERKEKKEKERVEGFQLHLRIPAWVRSGSIVTYHISTGSKEVKHLPIERGTSGYYTIFISEPENTEVLIDFNMEARLTCSHALVEENTNQVAIERGPLVYCIEGMDVDTKTIDDLLIPASVVLKPKPFTVSEQEVISLEGTILKRKKERDSFTRNALYQDYGTPVLEPVKARFIPYFAWANRGMDEMSIWLPVTDMSIAGCYKAVDKSKVDRLYEEELKNWDKKIVVLDDDPTGVQTVHGVSVYTDYLGKGIEEGLKEENNLFFLLTNSRSFTKEETEKEHRLIGEILGKAVKEGDKPLVISRSDSTLRGHYPLEMEVLKDTLEDIWKTSIDGQILCPYFLEGGRITIEGIHYVREGGKLIPAGETEFAKDKTFGYHSSHLGEYVEEKSEGKYKKEDCIYITLSLLREERYEEITEMLIKAKDFVPILVDGVEENDIKIFSICLLRAIKAGKEFLIRSGATLPKILGNIADRPLLSREELLGEEGKLTNGVKSTIGGMVIIGSHVKKTTEQLEELKNSSHPITFIEFQADQCFTEGERIKETKRVIAEGEASIAAGKTAVIYTSRTLLAPSGASKEELLKLSLSISKGLTEVVLGLTIKPKFLIAKGGITSSDIGTTALGVRKALVMGQVRPGVPVWKTGEESKFPFLPYIIFPGNVGEKDTLKQVVDLLS